MPSGTPSALAQITLCCFWNWRGTTAAEAAGNTTNADRSMTLVKPRPSPSYLQKGPQSRGPRTPPAVLLLHSGTFFPTSPRPARECCQVSVYSAEGPMLAMYKTITMLSIEITHCHKQTYCNSTFCRSPLFILWRWMRTSHNSHRRDRCLGMKMPVYPIKQ